MIAILDISIGNINSIYNAVYECGFDPIIVHEAAQFDDVSHLIFPGVGHFSTASALLEAKGLFKPLKKYVDTGRPFLGICLGMQLLADYGMEGAKSKGLGFIQGSVKRLDDSSGQRIPHVGWNNIVCKQEHPILADIKKNCDFYYTHSYAMICDNDADVIAETEYGTHFTSIVGHRNIVGVQFHPEKSQLNGLKLVENFCRWNGLC
jgi:glutamine amidotransferase